MAKKPLEQAALRLYQQPTSTKIADALAAQWKVDAAIKPATWEVLRQATEAMRPTTLQAIRQATELDASKTIRDALGLDMNKKVADAISWTNQLDAFREAVADLSAVYPNSSTKTALDAVRQSMASNYLDTIQKQQLQFDRLFEGTDFARVLREWEPPADFADEVLGYDAAVEDASPEEVLEDIVERRQEVLKTLDDLCQGLVASDLLGITAIPDVVIGLLMVFILYGHRADLVSGNEKL